MQHGKLLSLFFHLNKSELKSFKSFLGWNKLGLVKRDVEIATELIRRVDHLRKKAESEVWESLLTGSEYKDRYRISNRLLKAVEKYIVAQEINKDSVKANYVLSSYYAETGLMKNFKYTRDKTKKVVSGYFDFDVYAYEFWLDQHSLNLNKEIRKRGNTEMGVSDPLEEFYIGHKVRLLCEQFSRHTILRKSDSRFIEEELRGLISRGNSPLLKVYTKIADLIAKSKEEDFFYIMNFLEENYANFSEQVKRELYGYLLNFCIGKINKIHFSYANIYLDLFEKMGQEGLLLEAGSLSMGRLQNAILASLISGRFNSGSGILDKYDGFIKDRPEFKKESFVQINNAIIALHTNRPEDALIKATKFQQSSAYGKDVYQKLNCDKIMIKAAFQRQDFLFVESKIETTRRYLRKKQLPSDRLRKYNTFFQVLTKWLRNEWVESSKFEGELFIPDLLWCQMVQKKEKK